VTSLRFFTADTVLQFYLSLESDAVMAPSSKGLFVEQNLLENLQIFIQVIPVQLITQLEQDDLAIVKVIALQRSDKEGDTEEDATVSSVPSSSAIFTWDYVTKHVGPKEQSVGNCGPQNEAQNETHNSKVFKKFLLIN
jgi:hypothetical protein